MAGNLPVPQAAEVKITWGNTTIPVALNILHFDHDVGAVLTQAKADAISALIKAAYTSSGLAGQMHTQTTLLKVETRHMDSNSDPWLVGSGATVAGTGTGDYLPHNVACCVTLKTGLRGRSYNGRVFLWGWTEAANDAGGAIATAASTAAVNFVNTVKSNMSSAQQMDMGVVSRWTTPPGSPPNTPAIERNPPILTVVTQVVMLDNRWDTQRKRSIPGV